MKDLPSNSHVAMDILLSLSSFLKMSILILHYWGNHTIFQYLRPA